MDWANTDWAAGINYFDVLLQVIVRTVPSTPYIDGWLVLPKRHCLLSSQGRPAEQFLQSGPENDGSRCSQANNVRGLFACES
ncbi:hypothetical protein VCV18_000753 [Metarhizium anisopliae]